MNRNRQEKKTKGGAPGLLLGARGDASLGKWRDATNVVRFHRSQLVPATAVGFEALGVLIRVEVAARDSTPARDSRARWARVLSRDDPMMEYLCECDRAGCYERVRATRGEYESVRAEATHFIVLAGHEDRRVERVAFSNERFLIVEKQGAAARDAEETDPRS